VLNDLVDFYFSWVLLTAIKIDPFSIIKSFVVRDMYYLLKDSGLTKACDYDIPPLDSIWINEFVENNF